MPDRATFNRWRKRTPELQAEYDDACRAREEAVFDDIQYIADTERDYQKARNQIDARKWRLKCMNRKVYGDHVSAEHTGEGGGPLSIQIVRFGNEEPE